MKPIVIWMFISFFLSAATSADLLRARRDLTRVQNFVKWLLGINGRDYQGSVPLVGEVESERIFTIPGYENVLFRAIPQAKTNERSNQFFFNEARYFHDILSPVQYIRTTNQHIPIPIVIKKYPSRAIQENIKDMYSLTDYEYELPGYSYINQLSTDKEPVALFNLMSRNGLEGYIYDSSDTLVTTTSQPLPVPPVYVQNRMRDIIFGHPIPIKTAVQREIFNKRQDEIIPSPNLGNVELFNPLQTNRLKEHKFVNFETSSPQKTGVKTGSIFKSQAGGKGQLNKNSDFINDTKKTVTFTGPVQSRYMYKMLYHNEPHKNTIVKMENTNYAGPKGNKLSTRLPTSSTSVDQADYSESLKVIKNEIPADYLFVPPINTEEPPPGVPALELENNFVSPLNNAVSRDISLKNTPISVLDQSTYKHSVAHEVASTKGRSLNRQRQLKSSREINRGDIPQLSLK